MPNLTSPPSTPTSLTQLLRRGDIWRGREQLSGTQATVDTGHTALNQQLLAGGWPTGCLIDIRQAHMGCGEWQLLTPCLNNTSQGYSVLLNPPAIPLASGLLQQGIALQRVLLIHTRQKADFIAAFKELSRAPDCVRLLAWQPARGLAYAELRKCALAAAEGQGLYLLLRPQAAVQHSSPAPLQLYLRMGAKALWVHLQKQRGRWAEPTAIALPLPQHCLGQPPHHQWDWQAPPAAIPLVRQPGR